VVILWTYDGWSDINMVAGEVRDPRRALPRAVLIGTGMLIATYALVQAAVSRLLPAPAAAASDRVLADAVEAALGKGAGMMVAALVVLATFGSVHGIVLAASRLGWAMARDGVFFRWFGHVHPALGTPARAIGVLAATSAVYVFAAGFRNLLALFSFTVWIFYGLTAAGLIVLRNRGIGGGPGRGLAAMPVAPAVVMLTGIAMCTGLFAENPWRSLAGLALLLAGFPAHAMWRRLARRM
jgi:APA family basic amino acid/polyamine antiporter